MKNGLPKCSTEPLSSCLCKSIFELVSKFDVTDIAGI